MARISTGIIVQVPERDAIPLLVAEQLRYAGLISFERDAKVITKFTIYPSLPNPTKKNQEEWANRNAERIRSFGLSATSKRF